MMMLAAFIFSEAAAVSLLVGCLLGHCDRSNHAQSKSQAKCVPTMSQRSSDCASTATGITPILQDAAVYSYLI